MSEAVVKMDGEVAKPNTATGTVAAVVPTSEAIVPVGKLRRANGTSFKDIVARTEVAQIEKTQPVGPPITAEALASLWDDLLNHLVQSKPRLAEQLRERQVRLVDDDMFEIAVNNSYLDAEIKPHLIPMLTYMRQKSRRPLLNCRVVVEYEEHDAVIYTSRDKYDAMLKSNPALESFRVMFPDVDL